MEDVSASIQIIAVLDTVSLAGAELTITHVLLKAREKLIKHNILSFNESDKELPQQHYSF